MSDNKEVKKAGVKMPKSIKRMLALMGEEKRKVCQPVLYAAVTSDHYNRLQMLRRKSADKDEGGN